MARRTVKIDLRLTESEAAALNRDVKTIGVKSVLVASEKLGKDAVKKITQSLFTHAKELQYAVSVDYEPDPAAAVKDLPIELHEGAKEWYRENGIEISG